MRRVEAVGFRWFRERGGMPSIQLSPLSGRYLSFAEREEIALLNAQEAGVREITRWLGRSPATISQKLRRNGATRCTRLDYREMVAQWKAELTARCPKLVADARLRKYVQDRLRLLRRTGELAFGQLGQFRRPGGARRPSRLPAGHAAHVPSTAHSPANPSRSPRPLTARNHSLASYRLRPRKPPPLRDLPNSPGYAYLAATDLADIERDYSTLRAWEREGLHTL